MISNFLTHDELRDFLDEAIRNWRNAREAAKREGDGDKRDELMAECYIDAFQSIRSSVFGETLA